MKKTQMRESINLTWSLPASEERTLPGLFSRASISSIKMTRKNYWVVSLMTVL